MEEVEDRVACPACWCPKGDSEGADAYPAGGGNDGIARLCMDDPVGSAKYDPAYGDACCRGPDPVDVEGGIVEPVPPNGDNIYPPEWDDRVPT